MKNSSKIANICKTFFAISMICVLSGCVQYDNFKITEKPYVDRTTVELYIGEGAGDRNHIQLKSSPEGKQYVWTSLDQSVATVNSSGLITAVSEGFALITVASENDKTNVNVWVRNWVPLTGFTLSTDQIIAKRMDRVQVVAKPIPSNASEVNIEWSSNDTQIASVSENGWLLFTGSGSATVTARSGNITQEVKVFVLNLDASVELPKTKWTIPGYDINSECATIGYSSHRADDGGGMGIWHVIDGNTNTYWHSTYWNPCEVGPPHWFIVDLGEEKLVTHFAMQKRINQPTSYGQRGYELLTCSEAEAEDPTNPESWGWFSQGEVAFDTSNPNYQRFPLRVPMMTRYVKVFIAEKFMNNPYGMVGNVSVWVMPE